MKKSLFFLTIIVLFSSCGARVKTKTHTYRDPLGYKEEVILLRQDDAVPESALLLGVVKVGDTGFSKSNHFEDVIRHATEEARKAGGNILHLTKHKRPDMWATTHRIKANIYYMENAEQLHDPEEASPFLSPDVALIHVYRSNAIGSLVSFDLYLGDKLLCQVKNNWKMSIPITSAGLNSIWIRTEKKTELPIRIELGKEYYVRCSALMGFATARAGLELVDNTTGKLEFDAIQLNQ